MKILFISQELIGSGLCLRLNREGHDVKLFIKDPKRKKCLDGIINKIENWQNELSWVGKDGLIIFDDVGFGKIQDSLRKKGYVVVGGSYGGDVLEFDREFFQKIANSYGVSTPPSFNFNSCEEAIDFVRKNPKPWVVKQSTHVSMLNYVGESFDGEDVVGLLSAYNEMGIKNIHLQEKVVGIEVGVARYFNGNDWVGPIEINHEHKRLCNDDIGPLTAEMGTVMWHSEDESLPLFVRVLAPLKSYLSSINFRGDFDINCIVDKKNIWALEATPRFGTPSTQLQSELYTSSMADFLFAVGSGKDFNLKYKKKYGVVVSVGVPPFPYPPTSVSSQKMNNTICDFSKIKNTDWNSIYLEEISKNKTSNFHESYVWVGEFGYALYVTGSDTSIARAREKIHKILKSIVVPKMIYRTDIGKRLESTDLDKLRTWGWI